MRLRLAGSLMLDNDPSLEPTAWKQMILPFEIPVIRPARRSRRR
jgi:hypothetical protein